MSISCFPKGRQESVLGDVTNYSNGAGYGVAAESCTKVSDLKLSELSQEDPLAEYEDFPAFCLDESDLQEIEELDAHLINAQVDDEMMIVVDESDDADPQRVFEYATDIYDKLGRDDARRPQASYMENQPELDASARASVVDWLVGVHVKYKLKTETLFLAVSILDRFLATKRVQRQDLQLVASTAAFIAAKFEEIHPPELRDFVHICERSCRKEDLLTMEVRMLTALEFCLCRPTVALYLKRYQREAECTEAHASLLQYIVELSLLDLRMTRFPASLQAVAASLLSSKILKLNPVWPSMVRKSEHTAQAAEVCAAEMFSLLRNVERNSGEIWKKFSRSDFHSVATIEV